MSTAELAAAERAAEAEDGQAVPKSAYTSGEVARKAAAVAIPAYRFYNTSTGAHFYTTNEAERDSVLAHLSPPFSFERSAFSVASAFSPGLSAVHRFYNTQTGVHFYTISEAERANVVATLPHFQYEGVAYHASQVSGTGLLALHRFYLPSKGFHFYTANEAEKDSIIANLGATYSYEGVGYYVLGTDWHAEKLPHTGITDQQCYQAGSDTLVVCSGAGTQALNAQQDGHLSTVNAMSYSAVGTHPLSSCVKDDVTGLIWEGKPDDGGVRDKDNAYTHLGNGQSGDASGYVAAVNAAKLCGYSDWRLPTRSELLGIVHLGNWGGVPVDANWLVNTKNAEYWTANGNRADSSQAWFVNFTGVNELSHFAARNGTRPVRLVRGQSPSAQRFTYSTVAYGSDVANNVVNDAWTGLQWRRCEEGKVWTGASCTGTPVTLAHEQALTWARDKAGWRLPNIRELASLVDLASASPVAVDPVAFPAATVGYVWAATPRTSFTSSAWSVFFSYGSVDNSPRNGTSALRLVRSSP